MKMKTTAYLLLFALFSLLASPNAPNQHSISVAKQPLVRPPSFGDTIAANKREIAANKQQAEKLKWQVEKALKSQSEKSEKILIQHEKFFYIDALTIQPLTSFILSEREKVSDTLRRKIPPQ